MKSNRGMVLITVLWVILLLSVIAFSLAASVRTEVGLAQTGFDSDRAFFMAKGAAEVMFLALTQPAADWLKRLSLNEETGEYIFRFDSGEVRAFFDSGRSRININEASDNHLAAMLDSLGVDEMTRNRVVDSILDWRDSDDIPHLYGAEIQQYRQPDKGQRLPANESFHSVEELLEVQSMTPEIFFGRLVIDPSTGEYRRFPGFRDLVSVSSGGTTVDPNVASPDVLAALPAMTRELAGKIARARGEKPLAGSEDLVERIPELRDTEALKYLSLGSSPPVAIIARARALPSGASRTVRLFLRRDVRMEYTGIFAGYPPSYFKRVEEIKLDRWQYE